MVTWSWSPSRTGFHLLWKEQQQLVKSLPPCPGLRLHLRTFAITIVCYSSSLRVHGPDPGLELPPPPASGLSPSPLSVFLF